MQTDTRLEHTLRRALRELGIERLELHVADNGVRLRGFVRSYETKRIAAAVAQAKIPRSWVDNELRVASLRPDHESSKPRGRSRASG